MQWKPICRRTRNRRGWAYAEVIIGSLLLSYIVMVFFSFIAGFTRLVNYMETKNEVVMDGRFTRAMVMNRIRRTRGELVIKEQGNRIDSMKGDWKIGVRDRSVAAILSDGQRQSISQKTISPDVGVLRLVEGEGPMFADADGNGLIHMHWKMVVDPYEKGVVNPLYGNHRLSYTVHTKVLPDYRYFQWTPP